RPGGTGVAWARLGDHHPDLHAGHRGPAPRGVRGGPSAGDHRWFAPGQGPVGIQPDGLNADITSESRGDPSRRLPGGSTVTAPDDPQLQPIANPAWWTRSGWQEQPPWEPQHGWDKP